MIKQLIEEKKAILEILKKVNISNDEDFKKLISNLKEEYFNYALIKTEITYWGAEYSHTKAGEIFATIISLVYDWEGVLGVNKIMQEITEECFDKLEFRVLEKETAEEMIEIHKKGINFWERCLEKIKEIGEDK